MFYKLLLIPVYFIITMFVVSECFSGISAPNTIENIMSVALLLGYIALSYYLFEKYRIFLKNNKK